MAIKVSPFKVSDIPGIQKVFDDYGEVTPDEVVAKYLGPNKGLELAGDRKTVKVADNWMTDGDGRIYTYEEEPKKGIVDPKRPKRKKSGM